MNIWSSKTKEARNTRVYLRKRAYREAREHGLGHRAAQRCAADAWRWYDDAGRALPFSDAPRCGGYPS